MTKGQMKPRLFDGKLYQYDGRSETKRAAWERANRYRSVDQGNKARVVKSGKHYNIYTR